MAVKLDKKTMERIVAVAMKNFDDYGYIKGFEIQFDEYVWEGIDQALNVAKSDLQDEVECELDIDQDKISFQIGTVHEETEVIWEELGETLKKKFQTLYLDFIRHMHDAKLQWMKDNIDQPIVTGHLKTSQ